MRKLFLSVGVLFSFVMNAQFTENFSDGDFTNAPVWSGDAPEFIVNGTNQLQLNATVAGASYLSSPNAMASLNNMQWNVYVKQTFAPSSSNYGRVYLVSDQANLEGPLNGYYLQFGEALSNDAIELFEQTGTVSTSVCRGTNAQIAASFTVGVKVTRDAAGLWTLSVDAAGGTNYIQQATGTNTTHSVSSFLGVSTVYTVGNINKFFYDDFYAGPIVTDVTAPTIVSSTVVSANQLDVLFNEDVDLTTSQVAANYVVNNAVGAASAASRDGSDFKLVHLTFGNSFPSGIQSTLTVSAVQDLSANAIVSATSNFTYFNIGTAAYNDIIITELMADANPSNGLPLAEYVEIYNKGSVYYNLNGFKIADNIATGATITANYLLAPGAYALIASTTDTASFVGVSNKIGVVGMPSLNDAGDNIYLKSGTGVVIDSVNYLISWYQDGNKDGGGWSLELINPNANVSCPQISNWMASNAVLGGTPGVQNSVYSTAADVTAPSLLNASYSDATHITICFNEAIDNALLTNAANYSVSGAIGTPITAVSASSGTCVVLTLGSSMADQNSYTVTFSTLADCNGNVVNPISASFTFIQPIVATYKDVIINEIMADANPGNGLPIAEYVELYNRSTGYVELNGYKFGDNLTTMATITSSYLLAPNAYVLVASTADTASFVGITNKIGVSSFPSLNDGGDKTYLKSGAGAIIDSVHYDITWYNDAAKDGGGWSLELMNPNANVTCPAITNWTASNAALGGTPGAQNSVYSVVLDAQSPSLVSVNYSDATHIDVCFNEAIDVALFSSPASFVVSNGIGNPSSVSISTDGKCATLTLATSMTNLTNYTVTFSSLADCSGNLVTPTSGSFTYILPSVANYKDVIITEIMADANPSIGLPIAEYVELYNKSAGYIQLNGYKIADNIATGATITSNYLLAPNTYVLVASSADTASFVGISNKIGVSSFPSLNDGGDNVYLKSSSGAVIDSVNYAITWYNDVAKDDGGWSLELINPNANLTCPAITNWTASNAAIGGTPGIQNSVFSNLPDNTSPSLVSVSYTDSLHIDVCFSEAIDVALANNPSNFNISNGIGTPTGAGISIDGKCVALTLATSMITQTQYTVTFATLADCSGNLVSPNNGSFTYILPSVASYKDVIITEIMADANPSIGLPIAEYVELYNRGTGYVQLNGYKIADNIASGNTITTNFLLAPNAYVILTAAADTASFVGITNKIGFSSFPSLNDGGDNVYLKSDLGTIIDSVNYSISWYNNPNKDDGGWSLELINPLVNINCSQAFNWTASNNAIGGTPGAQNSVYSIAPDVTAPSIANVNVVDATHVTVCFSEPILASLLNNVSNYSINNGGGSPLSVVVSSDAMCVDMVLAGALVNQTNYVLTCSNLSDCSGNILNPNTANLSYYIAKTFDVVINEIMCDPDPSVALPNGEYLELKNKSNYSVSLNNWTIQVNSTVKTIPSIVIPSGGYVALMSASTKLMYVGNFPGLNVLEVPSFPSLTNTSGTIILRDNNGIMIHTVSYYDSWYADAIKADGGWSLEMIDANNPCGEADNWKASVSADGGTPAYANSIAASNPDLIAPMLDHISVLGTDTLQFYFNETIDSLTYLNSLHYTFDNGLVASSTIIPIASDFKSVKVKLSTPLQLGVIYTGTVTTGVLDCAGNPVGANNSARFALPQAVAVGDIVINEVLFDPNTGGEEFIEIYNKSNKTIDLFNVYTSDYDTLTNTVLNKKAISTDGYLFFPNEYLLLSRNGNTVKSQYTTQNPNAFLNVSALPSLSTEDVVALSTANDTAIDYLIYSDKMHFPLLNITKGVSLERIDFNRPSNDKTNWNSASSQVGFATPGYRNSQYMSTDAASVFSVSPETFSPDNDGYNDVININYSLNESGKYANITIYDAKGRFVKYLVKNELLGTTGTFSWNGITEQNEKAPIGIYVIYAEITDLAGKLTKHKIACVLAGKQ